MTLCETYERVLPSIVAFISRSAKTVDGRDPLLPGIFGTGFLVSERGIVATNRHVAECFPSFPNHPVTGENGYAAVLFDLAKEENNQLSLRWAMLEIESVGMMSEFSSDSKWYGEEKPDIAFVHLNVRDTPHLELADESYYVKPGTPIATAGFPMGRRPLTVMGLVNQAIPFLRAGIVSSVFPFSVPRPHGFTIDVMQQGGSSGSPIFYADRDKVVGMMASGMIDHQTVRIGNAVVSIPHPTNISIAVSSHMIRLALASFLQSEWAIDTSGYPTLQEWKASHEATEQLDWDKFSTS